MATLPRTRTAVSTAPDLRYRSHGTSTVQERNLSLPRHHTSLTPLNPSVARQPLFCHTTL
jgi:hypothetical protein